MINELSSNDFNKSKRPSKWLQSDPEKFYSEGEDRGKYSELYRSYSLKSDKDDSYAAKVQIIFNQILQGRKEARTGLTGSQITFILDYFITEIFSNILQLSSKSKLLHDTFLRIQKQEVRRIIIASLQSKKRLMSIRYSNSSVYCKIVNLNFVKTVGAFNSLFLKMRLNRNFYTDTVETILKEIDSLVVKSREDSSLTQYEESLLTTLKSQVGFLLKEFKVFKSLLTGNYVRLAFNDTNRFYRMMQEHSSPCDLPTKQDYFGGLIITTLNAIDRYDSLKGTLKTYIESWYKDYRLSYKDRLINSPYGLSEAAERNLCSSSEEEIISPNSLIDSIEDEEGSLFEQYLAANAKVTIQKARTLKGFIEENPRYFPILNKVLAMVKA